MLPSSVGYHAREYTRLFLSYLKGFFPLVEDLLPENFLEAPGWASKNFRNASVRKTSIQLPRHHYRSVPQLHRPFLPKSAPAFRKNTRLVVVLIGRVWCGLGQ
ncbi:Uncharacterized protein Adt_02926 [Abeliophyllum distichum]|uniref:Uncharacterized protein n=1 Tax=Abeliophyllum distichum TaxID=126358 RepID=A0ABD1VX32_9LAMI